MITYVDEEVEMTAVEFEHSSDSNDAPSSSSSNNKKKLIIITTALSLVALIAACIGVWSFDSSKKNESDDAAYDDEYDAMSSSSATNSNIQQQYQQVFTSSPTTLSPSLSPVAAPITSMPTTAEPTPQPTPEPTTPQPTPFPSMRPTFARKKLVKLAILLLFYNARPSNYISSLLYNLSHNYNIYNKYIHSNTRTNIYRLRNRRIEFWESIHQRLE